MGRVKLKIKRLETIDRICETFAKRKSIQETLLKIEEQKARVKESEKRLKEFEAGLNQAEELKNKVSDLTAFRKGLEGKLKEAASRHTPSEDPKKLCRLDALLKKREALEKKVTEKKKVMNEVLIIGDQMTSEEREKLTSDIDAEHAKLKQMEQDRKEIEKGAYLAIKELLRKRLASNLYVEHAKVKQLEQNRNEIEKGASLTSKEGLENKLASDADTESTKAKPLEQNRKEEIMHNFVELGKEDPFANDVGQTLSLNPELPMSMEEAPPLNMVKDDKIVTIRIGEMNVPLFPKPTRLATQAEEPAANP